MLKKRFIKSPDIRCNHLLGIIHLIHTHKFPKKLQFPTPDTYTYVCVSGGNKC